MYAVFRTGGKQYRASAGDRLRVERLDVEEGADVQFDEVLLVGSGSDIQVGTPTIAGTAVSAKVVRQGKTRKVPVVKFRRRQNYLRQGSHRQQFTEVEITAIGDASAPPAAAKTAKKKTAKKATKKAAAKKTAKKTAKKATKKKAAKADD